MTKEPDFSFDDNTAFFAPPKRDTSTSVKEVVNNVKKSGTTIDEDDDDDDDAVTNLTDQPDGEEVDDELPTKVKVKTPAKTVTDTEAEKNGVEKPKAKPKAKKEETEDDDDEDEDEEEIEINFDDEPAAPKKKKSEADATREAAVEAAKNKKKEDEEADDPIDDDFFVDLAKEMKQRGILSVDLPKDKKLTEDEFIDLQEAELEARVNETIDSFKDLDEEGKRFLQHKLKGGDTASFILAHKGTGINYDKLDFKKDADVQKVLNFYLKNVDGKDDDEITEFKEWLKDGGKEAAYAEKYANKLKKIDETRKKDFDAKEADRIKSEAENGKKFVTEFTEVLNKVDKIGQFPITEKEKKELKSYMITPTVKVSKNTYLPQVHVDIAKIMDAKTEKDKKDFILLSKLIKSKFDFSSIMPAVQTEVVREARNSLRRNRNNPAASSSGSYSKKGLADLFIEEADED